jgi:protein phosphatase
MIIAAGLSDIGCRRETNQDRISIDLQYLIFIVADGMGGERCGGLAAELVTTTVAEWLRKPGAGSDSWPFGYDASSDLASNRMRTAIHLANLAILEHSLERPECQGMGSTISVVTIEGKTATIGSLGDSRVYLRRSSALSPLTKDDSIVAHLLEAGQIEPADAHFHPMRNVLTQAAGKTQPIYPQVTQLILNHTDRLLLSTDGLHGVIGDEIINEIAGYGDDLEAAARNLIAEGRSLGAPDNISCVLIEYVDGD